MPNEFLGQCLKLMMTRTFMIMACIFSAFGAMLLLTKGITKNHSPTLIICSKSLVVASLICGIIGFSVGTSWAIVGFGKLAAAAILAIVATVLNLISAIFGLAIGT
jgi:hypothetical protein